jgi:hypothetical protein
VIDKRDSLTIKHDDNGVFTDYSHKLSTYGRDGVTLTITNAEDFIYIGFDKPINSVYIDITTANGAEGSLTFEYYNGSTYTTVTSLSDDTLGAYRSGFIRWDKDVTDQVVSTVDSLEKYWYKVLPSVDRTGIVIGGINLVFSDDYELSLEQPYISDAEFLGSEGSHIKTHQAVKKEIIQKFRNKNYQKIDSNGDPQDITVWDLHDIDEVGLAATYLALSKIYFQMSDNPDDVWGSKSKYYEEKFIKYINVARLSLDTNDDGKEDSGELKQPFKNRYLTR